MPVKSKQENFGTQFFFKNVVFYICLWIFNQNLLDIRQLIFEDPTNFANFGNLTRFARISVNLLLPNRFSYGSEIFREVFWLSKIAKKIMRSNLSARTWKLWWFQILQLTRYIRPPSRGAILTSFFLGHPTS